MITINKSIPSSFGKLTSTIFGPYTLYTCSISCEIIDKYLPNKLSSFPSLSWTDSMKRDFFYSKPILLASRSQISDHQEELSHSITTEDFFKNLLLEKNNILRYNFIITGNNLAFIRIPHTRHISYHILGKHITLANYCNDVRFAGEFWHDENNKYLFNNNSGTYRPSNILIEKTVQIFNELIPYLEFQGISYKINCRPSINSRFIYKLKKRKYK